MNDPIFQAAGRFPETSRRPAPRVVGVSDLKVSDDPSETLVTYSLGSCVGLALYDPAQRLGGLLHAMLPLSILDQAKARENPLMFTDLAVTLLLRTLFDRGARRERLVAKVAGGASLLDPGGHFRIGLRNYTVVRKILWKNRILLDGEDIGGLQPRTLSLQISDGTTLVRRGGVEWKL